MNKYELFDVMGGIDEDLLERSERQARKRLSLRRAFIAAAAVMLLAATVLASPTVREWFFGSHVTRITDANIVRQTITVTDEDGEPYSYEVQGWQESSARVDLNLEGIGETPETILELRIPVYFESGGWEYTPCVHFPDEELTRYIGIWQRWIEEDGEKIGQYIIFHQSTINPAAGEYPAGYGQFSLELGNSATVEETTLTIGDHRFQVYQVGYSELEGVVTFGPHTDVIWSDGEYAYHISTGGMDLDMIADIIRSIVPAEDLRDYIRPAVFDSIETRYTLSVLPEGLERTSAEDHGYSTWQAWGDTHLRGVELKQQRVQNDGSDIDNRDLDLTLSDQLTMYPDARIETLELDGIEISLVRLEEDVKAYWTQDGCDFTLCFWGYPDLSTDQIGACIRSLIPVEEFPE